MNGVKTGAMGLLDILAAKSGCMYLSDLAGTGTNAFLLHHLHKSVRRILVCGSGKTRFLI